METGQLSVLSVSLRQRPKRELLFVRLLVRKITVFVKMPLLLLLLLLLL
jgi:hypothetical protein